MNCTFIDGVTNKELLRSNTRPTGNEVIIDNVTGNKYFIDFIVFNDDENNILAYLKEFQNRSKNVHFFQI